MILSSSLPMDKGGMGYSFHLMVEEEKKKIKYKQIFFFIYFSSPLPPLGERVEGSP